MDESAIFFMIAGLILQGIFYGVYFVIFCLYVRIHFKRADRWKSLLVYAVIANFILCTAFFALDIAHGLLHVKWHLQAEVIPSLWFSSNNYLSNTEDALYTCIDIISQGILIYRCWIVWRRPLIMVVPIILSLAFLATALTTLVFITTTPGYGTATAETPSWYDIDSAVVSFFSISLVLNALVTGLIVFKILDVYRNSRGFKDPTGAVYTYRRGPPDLYLMMSILVESGMITFVMQLAQTVLYGIDSAAFHLVFGIVVMLYGISMTIVLVRVQIGVNYDNETSRIVTSRALRFAPFESDNQVTENGPNSGWTLEMKIVEDV